MYNSSHLSRLLALEHQRELLAVAEREREARAASKQAAPPPVERVAVFTSRPRLLRWAAAARPRAR